MSERFAFVPSTAIPDWMVEKVAKTAHSRGCGSFDGGRNRAVAPPRFVDSHRDLDLVWASIHLADICNSLKITPDQLAAITGEAPS